MKKKKTEKTPRKLRLMKEVVKKQLSNASGGDAEPACQGIQTGGCLPGQTKV